RRQPALRWQGWCPRGEPCYGSISGRQSGDSVMNRRTIIRTAAGTLVAALVSARGQQPDKVWRVGILDPGIPHLFAAFRESMRDRGFVERRNVRFEEKNANGNP